MDSFSSSVIFSLFAASGIFSEATAAFLSGFVVSVPSVARGCPKQAQLFVCIVLLSCFGARSNNVFVLELQTRAALAEIRDELVICRSQDADFFSGLANTEEIRMVYSLR